MAYDMPTKLQRYLFDLSRIPPKEREKYLRSIERLSDSGIIESHSITVLILN